MRNTAYEFQALKEGAFGSLLEIRHAQANNLWYNSEQKHD